MTADRSRRLRAATGARAREHECNEHSISTIRSPAWSRAALLSETATSGSRTAPTVSTRRETRSRTNTCRAAPCAGGCTTASARRRPASCRRAEPQVADRRARRVACARRCRNTARRTSRGPTPTRCRHVEEAVAVRRIRAARRRAVRRLQRRVDEEIRHVAIEAVAPRISFGLRAAARGLLPLRLGRQPEGLAGGRRQPRAVRDRVVVSDERDGMIGAIGQRMAVLPDVRPAGLAERRARARAPPALTTSGSS